jgi:hypothetical protein
VVPPNSASETPCATWRPSTDEECREVGGVGLVGGLPGLGSSMIRAQLVPLRPGYSGQPAEPFRVIVDLRILVDRVQEKRL